MQFFLALLFSLPLAAAVPPPHQAVEPLAGFVAAEDDPTSAASMTLLGRRSVDGSRTPMRINKRSGLKHRRSENDDHPRLSRSYRDLLKQEDLLNKQVGSLTPEELNLLGEDTDYFVTRSEDERIQLSLCFFKQVCAPVLFLLACLPPTETLCYVIDLYSTETNQLYLPFDWNIGHKRNDRKADAQDSP